MRILLDTGTVLVDLALKELFLFGGLTARSVSEAHQDFSPDIILLGNNFDTTDTIPRIRGAKVLVLDIGLSAHRLEEALRSPYVDGILSHLLDLEGFKAAARQILDPLLFVRSLLNYRLMSNSSAPYN